ncbi:hypothetical protein H2198_009824 [Neophaeococcomyces mojaviensis]|uniref:Uncharacterized protein n=1 Tax=Neophaeococcomyces mojaviensis TaxID=3383035 RepID=A0ACC2ZTC6_9EURO|nr:hypothetical protein H2198_009824 [Knufia sp. JES_112]
MSTSSTRLSTPIGGGTPRPSTPTTTTNTSHPAFKLLSKAQSDPETATKIFAEKIIHKPLLLSTSTDHAQANARTARRHLQLHKKTYALKHARPKPLSAKEKRSLNLYELKPLECRYEIYRGLNALWRRYILEVLGYVDREGRVVETKTGQPVSVNGGGALIASADFHGMEVEVVGCVDQGRVGCRGIVVRETRSTVVIVCDERERSRRKLQRDGKAGDVVQDKVRMILKKGTVFRIVIDLPSKEENGAGRLQAEATGSGPTAGDSTSSQTALRTKRQLVFELHGDQLGIRPIERAVKKFKWKPMDYL